MPEQTPAEQEHTEMCPWARAYEQLATILRATAEGLHLPAGGDFNAIPAAAAATYDAARNLRVQLDRANLGRQQLADELELDRANLGRQQLADELDRLTADHAHRQLHAIREARAHHCDRYCTEGGCDFDLSGFVDAVDEILAAPAPPVPGSSPRAQDGEMLLDWLGRGAPEGRPAAAPVERPVDLHFGLPPAAVQRWPS